MPRHLTLKDKWAIEDLRPGSGDAVFGEVTIDRDSCTGCGMCVRVCPANTLEMADKKSRMKAKMPMCISCGDCVAACPKKAVILTRFIEFRKRFRYLDRGAPEFPRKF